MMKSTWLLGAAMLLAGPLTAALPQQTILDAPASGAVFKNHSHLSEWCSLAKQGFLDSFKDGTVNEWVVVVGNEAADTDTMVSSMAMAYHLAHRKKNREKAVALLQIDQAAIDLRPENKLALERSRMESVHRDLLTLDQLPFYRGKVGQMVKGLVLVDHNRPLSFWRGAPILGIIDHHEDRGLNSTAQPRVIEMVGSASSLVTQVILEEGHPGDFIPDSLADLLLTTIALDTKGLKKGKAKKADKKSAKGIFPYTSYSAEGFKKKATLKKLGKEMKKAEGQLDGLNLTQLYTRDFKGDMVYNSTRPIKVGYANMPISFADMVKRSTNGTREAFFEESRAWVRDYGINVLIVLTKYKDDDGNKVREVILFVKHGKDITEDESERLYHKLRDSLESDENLELKAWKGEKEWGHQRYAWIQGGSGEGRKTVRPIVEKAVQEW